jgi:hypothetical protein
LNLPPIVHLSFLIVCPCSSNSSTLSSIDASLSSVPLVFPLPMGICQGVAMDSLKFHPALKCRTLLRPAGGPPLKRPYSRFRGSPLTGWAACGRLQLLRTPNAERLCIYHPSSFFHRLRLLHCLDFRHPTPDIMPRIYRDLPAALTRFLACKCNFSQTYSQLCPLHL